MGSPHPHRPLLPSQAACCPLTTPLCRSDSGEEGGVPTLLPPAPPRAAPVLVNSRKGSCDLDPLTLLSLQFPNPEGPSAGRPGTKNQIGEQLQRPSSCWETPELHARGLTLSWERGGVGGGGGKDPPIHSG